jgi:hypothetical protein
VKFLKIFPVRCSLIAYTKGRFIGQGFGEGPIGCSNIYINYFVMIAVASRSVVQSRSEVSLSMSVCSKGCLLLFKYSFIQLYELDYQKTQDSATGPSCPQRFLSESRLSSLQNMKVLERKVTRRESEGNKYTYKPKQNMYSSETA